MKKMSPAIILATISAITHQAQAENVNIKSELSNQDISDEIKDLMKMPSTMQLLSDNAYLLGEKLKIDDESLDIDIDVFLSYTNYPKNAKDSTSYRQTANVNEQLSCYTNCHNNCHSNCHSNCFGARGWR